MAHELTHPSHFKRFNNMTEKYEFENPNPHQYVFLQFVRVMGFKFNCSILVLSSVVCGKHQEERNTTEKCNRTCSLKRMNDNVKCCRKRNTNRKQHEWWNDVNIIIIIIIIIFDFHNVSLRFSTKY